MTQVYYDTFRVNTPYLSISLKAFRLQVVIYSHMREKHYPPFGYDVIRVTYFYFI